MGMTSCPEAMDWGFWNLKKRVSWDSTLEVRLLIFGACQGQTSSLRQGAAWGGVWWKSQHKKKLRLSLSLLMSKTLKLKKVNKSFVPEPISCFSDSYMFMNICEHFPVSVWICLFPVFIIIFGHGYATLFNPIAGRIRGFIPFPMVFVWKWT